MKTETRNFKIVSAIYEKRWGSPLISGHTYSGDAPVAVFVALDNDTSFTGYGTDISEAIINLETNLYNKLKDHCSVK